MIALWYRDGELQEAPFQDGRSRILWRDPTRLDPVLPWREVSRRERRAMARRGRPRRSARPVARLQPDLKLRRSSVLGSETAYDGHRLSDGRIDVLLYMPQGERVGQRHLAEVERWILAKGKTDG